MTESIAVFLNEFRDGKTLAELTKAKADLIRAVRETGKAGTLTWKLSIKPQSVEDSDKLIISDELTLSEPKHGRSADFFFATEDNGTSRKHPRQRELELRSVDHTLELKEIKA